MPGSLDLFLYPFIDPVQYKYPLLRSRSQTLNPALVRMDPLSFHSVNPFATFYPPQSAEYDVYPVRDIITSESSLIDF